MNTSKFAREICQGIPVELPKEYIRSEEISHAPVRNIKQLLSAEEKVLAVQNALRYFPKSLHDQLALEFLEELKTYGRIYMYRYKPSYEMYARPISAYPSESIDAAAIMLMIQNNLDPKVAKHPDELITYGGNGAVFQNWAQYLLCMQYLSKIREDQTLVLYSGHPLGIFPSNENAPRVVLTNGMMIPNYSSKDDWNKYNALGVTQYGQMTAGSFMYIGPQGIVHGTTITLMNAGRKLDPDRPSLKGKLFVSSGLGGMSGAQTLAGTISGATTVIAEVDQFAIDQRITDGYVDRNLVYDNLSELFSAIKLHKLNGNAISLIYHGNIVDLWEEFVKKNILVELGSDQTSLHNIDELGYCPVGFNLEEAQDLLIENKNEFKMAIRKSLIRQVNAINKLTERGMYFWDYGNAFLKEAGEAGADIFSAHTPSGFRYASYVEDIMGPICFDYGFGPFRWVCTTGELSDLEKTDEIAKEVLRKFIAKSPPEIHSQLADNILWIDAARKNIPIVGSKSRILYADSWTRIAIAEAFNEAISSGVIKGPIVLGRDHHDVSGTDSPFRETANIYDGSRFTADMAIHNVIGDAFRGASWVSIHNGGGVGWGDVINGGFGLVLDGSSKSLNRLRSMLFWDVNNGIARRAWARNDAAVFTAQRSMKEFENLCITIPSIVDENLLKNLQKKV